MIPLRRHFSNIDNQMSRCNEEIADFKFDYDLHLSYKENDRSSHKKGILVIGNSSLDTAIFPLLGKLLCFNVEP